MNYKLEIATFSDIDGMVEIENEHFKGEELCSQPYKRENFEYWMNINKEICYVLKNKEGLVVAYTFFVPVTKICYNRLRKGEINDIRQFEEGDILPINDSKYYYTASIAIRSEYKSNFKVTLTLLKGIAKFFNEHGEFVITTPVTKEGLSLATSMGYAPLGKEGLENNYEFNVLFQKQTLRYKKFCR